MDGYWKFHRAMEQHAVWSLPAAHFKVWITIINHVNVFDRDWDDGTTRFTIPAGSVVTSQAHLCDYSGESRQSVRAALTNLIRLKSISTKIATKKYTIITVINWPIYNGIEAQANQDSNQLPTKCQPSANHNLRKKEGKKEPSVGDKAPTNGHHPIKALLTIYDDTYLRLHGQRPVITSADAKAAEAILKNRDAGVASRMVTSFLENPPGLFKDQRLLSMRHILSAANTLLARREVSG